MRRHPSEWGIKGLLRDLHSLEYSYSTYEEQHAICRQGTGPFWITTSRYLRDPLPTWAVAALVAGECISFGSTFAVASQNFRRFPRYLFGHEWYQQTRSEIDPNYVDIRRRAATRFIFSTSAEKEEIRFLVREFQRPFHPLIFRELGENQGRPTTESVVSFFDLSRDSEDENDIEVEAGAKRRRDEL